MVQNFQNVLANDKFDEALIEVRQEVRKEFLPYLKIVKVIKEDDKTVISVYGGMIEYVIDHVSKSLYKNVHVLPQPLGMKDDYSHSNCMFSLNFTPKVDTTTLSHKIYRRIKEKMVALGAIPIGGTGWCKPFSVRSFYDVLRSEGRTDIQEWHDELTRQEKAMKQAAAIAINSSLGTNLKGKRRRFQDTYKIVAKMLWEHLDRDVVRLCFAACNRKFTSHDYELMWRNKDELLKVFEHSPALIPVWYKAASTGSIPNAATHYPNFVTTNAVADCQAALRTGGDLSQKGWRYLLSLNQVWSRSLVNTFMFKASAADFRNSDDMETFNFGHFGPSRITSEQIENRIGSMAKALDFLAEVGDKGKYTPWRFTLHRIKWRVHSKSLTAVVRAAFKASHKKKAKTFYRAEFQLVWDWFSRNGDRALNRGTDGCVELDANQRKRDWSWFMRQQHEWHERVLTNKKLNIRLAEWDSLVGKQDIDGYTVIPLTDSHSLYDEGQTMHHCVASYSEGCESGYSRIFSICKDGVNMATLEITKREEPGPELKCTWNVAQCRAHCNKDPEKSIGRVAKKIASDYTEMYNDQLKVSPELAEHHA